MARRSAKQPEPPEDSALKAGASAFVGVVLRNPMLVGGSTAFLVALSFVSANALWYQPHAHSGAFFSTRGFSGDWPVIEEPDTTITIERPEPAAAVVPTPRPDPRIEKAQTVLKSLNFYAGEVDGLSGPNTRKAIENYQSKTGMAVTGLVDDALLEQLGASPVTSGITPSTAPRGLVQDVSARIAPDVPIPPDQRVLRIQAGLKAFGNDAIKVDGVAGAQTKAAILEFQGLFDLPKTGEPDEHVYAKMKEIGLTN